MVAALVALVGAPALLAGMYLYGRKLRDDRGADSGVMTSELHDAVRAATGVNVLNYDYAQRAGVRKPLLWLLREWDAKGSHPVRVFEGDKALPSGAVRFTDAEQAAAAGAGLSKAKDVNATAHGPKWRAALDVHPMGFNPWRSFKEQPGMFDRVKAFVAFAENAVFVDDDGTEYRFQSGKNFPIGPAPDGVMGDWVHIEILGWRSLPPLA